MSYGPPFERPPGPEYAPDYAFSKEEAARILGCSTRNLERLAAGGQIRKWLLPKQPSERTRRVVYDREDVQRVARGEKLPAAPDERPAAAREENLPALAKPINPARVVRQLEKAITRALARPQPWQRLRGAAKASGLPVPVIRAMLPALAKDGNAVRVAGSRPHWIIRVAALDAPITD